jgi:hypothetical protein
MDTPLDRVATGVGGSAAGTARQGEGADPIPRQLAAARRRILFGATTYRGAITYWPHQLEVPDMPESHYYIAQRYVRRWDDSDNVVLRYATAPA